MRAQSGLHQMNGAPRPAARLAWARCIPWGEAFCRGHRAAMQGGQLAAAGTTTNGVIGCDRPRALDLAARGGKKLESALAASMNKVPAALTPMSE